MYYEQKVACVNFDVQHLGKEFKVDNNKNKYGKEWAEAIIDGPIGSIHRNGESVNEMLTRESTVKTLTDCFVKTTVTSHFLRTIGEIRKDNCSNTVKIYQGNSGIGKSHALYNSADVFRELGYFVLFWGTTLYHRVISAKNWNEVYRELMQDMRKYNKKVLECWREEDCKGTDNGEIEDEKVKNHPLTKMDKFIDDEESFEGEDAGSKIWKELLKKFREKERRICQIIDDVNNLVGKEGDSKLQKEIKDFLAMYTKTQTNGFRPGETKLILLVAASQHFDFFAHYGMKVSSCFPIPPTVSLWEIIGYMNYFEYYAFREMDQGSNIVNRAKLDMIKEGLKVSTVMPRQVIQGIMNVRNIVDSGVLYDTDSESMVKMMTSGL